MLRVLLVTYGFHPHQSPRSFRANELVKEFIRRGHSVKVIAPYRPGIESFLTRWGIDFKDLGSLTWKSPHFFIATWFGYRLNRLIARLLELLFEYPWIQLVLMLRVALKSESGYDLLISIAHPYPIHWGVALSRSVSNPIATTWIADCGDPYMGRENESFRPPFYFAWIEKWFCRRVDYLSVPTEEAKVGYFPEFRDIIRVIPQGFRFQDYNYPHVSRVDGKVIFGYGGMFIPGRRDPMEFLSLLRILESKFDFEFHIYTSTPHHVLPYIDGMMSVKLFPAIDREDVLRRFYEMNFLVNFSNKGKVQTPSKLIDYVILRKPILNVDTGNLDADNVVRFLQGDYSGAYLVEDQDQYRIERVVDKFVRLIQ